jgi:hypothetical protein
MSYVRSLRHSKTCTNKIKAWYVSTYSQIASGAIDKHMHVAISLRNAPTNSLFFHCVMVDWLVDCWFQNFLLQLNCDFTCERFTSLFGKKIFAVIINLYPTNTTFLQKMWFRPVGVFTFVFAYWWFPMQFHLTQEIYSSKVKKWCGFIAMMYKYQYYTTALGGTMLAVVAEF